MASENDVAYTSAVSLLDLYRARALSPVEATRLLLDRLDVLQPKINAFCTVDRDGALAAAHESERRWQRGEAVGRLDGVPVTIKDLLPWATVRSPGSPAIHGISRAPRAAAAPGRPLPAPPALGPCMSAATAPGRFASPAPLPASLG